MTDRNSISASNLNFPNTVNIQDKQQRFEFFRFRTVQSCNNLLLYKPVLLNYSDYLHDQLRYDYTSMPIRIRSSLTRRKRVLESRHRP